MSIEGVMVGCGSGCGSSGSDSGSSGSGFWWQGVFFIYKINCQFLKKNSKDTYQILSNLWLFLAVFDLFQPLKSIF
jgi:hypothetical protein